MDLNEYYAEAKEVDPRTRFVVSNTAQFKLGIIANIAKEYESKNDNPSYLRGKAIALEFNRTLEKLEENYMKGIWDGWTNRFSLELEECPLYQQGRGYIKAFRERASIAIDEEVKRLEIEYAQRSL